MNFLATLQILAQDTHTPETTVEESSGIDLLLPETSELIAGILAFVIIFVFVWKWALPAVSKMLAARRDAITGQLSEAEKTKVEAEELLADYNKQLADARGEGNRIVDEARQSAEAVRAEIVERAEADAQGITRKAREEAAAEKQRAAAEVRTQVADLSLELAQMVVAGSVDEQTQKNLVDRYIDDIPGLKE